ncbi:MAG: hypothetical protein PHR83_14980 [Paludibacter sp.]|nr:hypothetical protein [Paludibacter sp.]
MISNSIKSFILLTILTFTSGLFAQSPYSKTIYSAFIVRDMGKWENVIHTMEASNTINTVDEKLELINYYYGYIGYLLGSKQYAHVEKLTERGEKLIAQVLHVSPHNATAYSFKGSFIAFHVGVNKFKAVFLGAESRNCVNKALELDPQNIQGLIDKGNQLFYAPEMLGGDKKEALTYFHKAAGILERRKETSENWVYLNVLTMIASAYEKVDDLKNAKITYEKVIHNEPNITWVKNDLYPNLLTRINGK